MCAGEKNQNAAKESQIQKRCVCVCVSGKNNFFLFVLYVFVPQWQLNSLHLGSFLSTLEVSQRIDDRKDLYFYFLFFFIFANLQWSWLLLHRGCVRVCFFFFTKDNNRALGVSTIKSCETVEFFYSHNNTHTDNDKQINMSSSPPPTHTQSKH